MPQDVLARITKAMREASGDYRLVPYHLRHAARTQMLLWASTQPTASLPGAAPPTELMAGPEVFRRLHFAAEAPTRRSGYQEAVVAGHSSPATTYGTYMHALDWICHRAVLHDHPIDDAVLAQLSGFRSANVRQIRRRSGGVAGGGQAVLMHVLKQGDLPAPPEWANMTLWEKSPTSVRSGRQRASSLTDVAEVLRLFAGGQPKADTAQRLDVAPTVIERWVQAAQRISRESGYPLAALAEKSSFEGVVLDVVGQAISDLLCDPTTPTPEWWTAFQSLWCERYIHRLAMPYFSDAEELTTWISGLVRLPIISGEVRLMAPQNVPGTIRTFVETRSRRKSNLVAGPTCSGKSRSRPVICRRKNGRR